MLVKQIYYFQKLLKINNKRHYCILLFVYQMYFRKRRKVTFYLFSDATLKFSNIDIGTISVLFEK